jgi:hypothetical protein
MADARTTLFRMKSAPGEGENEFGWTLPPTNQNSDRRCYPMQNKSCSMHEPRIHEDQAIGPYPTMTHWHQAIASNVRHWNVLLSTRMGSTSLD